MHSSLLMILLACSGQSTPPTLDHLPDVEPPSALAGVQDVEAIWQADARVKPICAGSGVVVADRGWGDLIGFDLATGAVRWELPEVPKGSMAVMEPSPDCATVRYVLSTKGKTVWSSIASADGSATPILAAGPDVGGGNQTGPHLVRWKDLLVMVGGKGVLAVRDHTTEPLWFTEAEGLVPDVPPQLIGDKLLVGCSSNGKFPARPRALCTVDLATGAMTEGDKRDTFGAFCQVEQGFVYGRNSNSVHFVPSIEEEPKWTGNTESLADPFMTCEGPYVLAGGWGNGTVFELSSGTELQKSDATIPLLHEGHVIYGEWTDAGPQGTFVRKLPDGEPHRLTTTLDLVGTLNQAPIVFGDWLMVPDKHLTLFRWSEVKAAVAR